MVFRNFPGLQGNKDLQSADKKKQKKERGPAGGGGKGCATPADLVAL